MTPDHSILGCTLNFIARHGGGTEETASVLIPLIEEIEEDPDSMLEECLASLSARQAETEAEILAEDEEILSMEDAYISPMEDVLFQRITDLLTKGGVKKSDALELTAEYAAAVEIRIDEVLK